MRDARHLRIARPTDDLDALFAFYTEALGLNGVMLGHPEMPYHFEFTHAHGHKVGRAHKPENLLAFYFANYSSWQEAVNRIESFGASPVRSFNPFWDRHGRTYEDPNGYRIVLHDGPWPIQA